MAVPYPSGISSSNCLTNYSAKCRKSSGEAPDLVKNPEIQYDIFLCFVFLRIKKDLRTRDETSGLKEIPASNYSPALYCAVPSSWRFLTIVFGMGTCVTPSLWTPEKNVKEVRCLEKQTN